MVARKHAEAAGIDRQALAQAVLRREIGQRTFRREDAEILHGRGHIGIKGFHRGLVEAQIRLLVREDDQARGRGGFDGGNRVVTAALPLLGMEGGEKRMAFGMPAPPQVAGQFAQASNGLGKRGHGGKAMQRGRGGHGSFQNACQRGAARRGPQSPTRHGLVERLIVSL